MDGAPVKNTRPSLIACCCILMETNPAIDFMAQIWVTRVGGGGGGTLRCEVRSEHRGVCPRSHLLSIFTGSTAAASYTVDLFQLSYGSRWSRIHRSLIMPPRFLVLLWDINYTPRQYGIINRKHCDTVSEKNSFLLAVFWDFITSNAPRMPANT